MDMIQKNTAQHVTENLSVTQHVEE